MSDGSSQRIHSMDALRASTMLLLVPVHAATILALNGDDGAWATTVYWLVHVFRLPLFFAMSGFFLVLLLSRKGLGETARNRTLRILVPLALGLVTLVPLTVFAAQQTGTAMAVDGVPGGSPFNFEPGFLWFLWYLLIVDAAAVALYLLAPRLLGLIEACSRAILARPSIGIFVLAVPTALVLLSASEWTIAPAANTFVPEPAALVYYALFFGLGATLCAHRELVAAAGRNAWLWVAGALAAALPAGLLYSLHNSGAYGSQPEVHAAAMLIYAIATWASLFALVGLADRYLNRPRPALRYMADSSYWIYLSHLPAMVLVVALVETTALATAPKFALATLGALAFSLITYPLFVRYTVIGRVLNGPRHRSTSEPPQADLQPRDPASDPRSPIGQGAP